MKLILLFFLLFTQVVSADSNLTAQVKTAITNLLTSTEETNKSKETNRSNSKKELEEEKNLQEKIKENQLKVERVKQELEKQKKEAEAELALTARINVLVAQKKEIDEHLLKDNIWASLYYNHETYQSLDIQLQSLNDKIRLFKNKSSLSKKEKIEYQKIKGEYQTIEGKLSQLKEYKDDPFKKLVTSPEIGEEPTITNPIDIIKVMSFQKQLTTVKEEYAQRYKTLNNAIAKLYQKSILLQELVVKTRGEIYNNYVDELRATEHKLVDFERTLAIFETSVSAFEQKVAQINLNIDHGIDNEIEKSIITGSIILFILLFFFFIKYLVKKYMSDNELFYGTNKVINSLFIVLVFTILLFSYLENIEHLVTVLSFASAGIAIALKDWFMSIIGWFVILVSGSIHVGDRVKFFKDGVEYVGDVVDISILRMTLHEDVTLTTTTLNRRAGRIIFIPNNYIFTDMIANYSHSGLKTVWDGIDFLITFDSNVAKAQHIAKDVTRKYSKGYTDMTRKQLNKLRSKYSMRNTAVEPRIFGFMDSYGVRISAWYLTNAYATLTLRSTISMEILTRLNEEDDIFLALPSQSLYMDKPAPKLPLAEGEEPTQEHRVDSNRPKNEYDSKGRGV
ncbi:mechanosensitive ion channel [bacterium]|nr:mechanosensitive ion channel [bacterium]MBU1957215.1 mechanosensitive ion channel [bacterium]